MTAQMKPKFNFCCPVFLCHMLRRHKECRHLRHLLSYRAQTSSGSLGVKFVQQLMGEVVADILQ